MPASNTPKSGLMLADAHVARRDDVRARLSASCTVYTVDTLTEALPLLNNGKAIRLLMVSVDWDHGAGMDLCRAAGEIAQTAAIVLDDAPTLERAADAINRGHAWLYLQKPDAAAIMSAVDQVLRDKAWQRQYGDNLDALHQSNVVLQEKVDERTRELVALNEELRVALDQMQMLVSADELTGLLNRRAMMQRLDTLIKQSRRYNIALSCVLCDIEALHQVNITYGEARGDRLLIEVARRLRTNIREVDIPCRVGGSQFLLILPHTTSEQAGVVVQHLRQGVIETPYALDGQHLAIRMHFGVAELAQDIEHAGDLWLRAEHALREARAAAMLAR